MVTVVASFGPSLQPGETKPRIAKSTRVCGRRIAMVAILSLPVIAFFGSFEKNVPEDGGISAQPGVSSDVIAQRAGILKLTLAREPRR
jgi:hypothetical protein